MLPDSPPTSPRADRGVWGFAVLLAVAGVLAWSNSFGGPFVLDDMPAIAENATIRGFASAFSPPGDGQTVSGRPLVNLSFALNWALGGERVGGYHVFNLAIHVLAGLALFGVVRRTLLALSSCPNINMSGQNQTPVHRRDADATLVAFVIAALWLLHPLQTESVTYLSQRAESMAGLWLLLTLYASIRGSDCHPLDDNGQNPIGDGKIDCHLMDDNRQGPLSATAWHVIGFVACLAGMASKEVMYAAPLLVLLHDRTFFAGTFREALRRRPWFYLALAATWLLLGWLVARTGTRGQTAGFGLGISPWHYLLTQCGALLHYLKLAVWPTPLVLDYGFAVVKSPAGIWLQAVVLLALFGATFVGVVRGAAWSFLGAWYFLLLAPSSSVVPVATQTIAEHRMYLALAAIATAVVVGLWRALGRRGVLVALAAAIGLGALTAARNADYRSTIGLWQDTATKRPGNPRAFSELANSLYAAGRVKEALAAYEHTLRMLPVYPKAHHNYAGALASVGRVAEAEQHFKISIAQSPTLPEAHYGLGNLYRETGHKPEAIACYERALQLRPGFAAAHNNLANLLAEAGRIDDACAHFAAALRVLPNFPDAEFNWGNTLARAGRPADALPHYEAAIRLAPGFAAAHENLGVSLAMIGRVAEGIAELEAALRIEPGRETARANLAAARAQLAK